MSKNFYIGKLGENLASNYLKSNGYKIILRNFRKPFGEIDIIAQKKDGTLVFVEVKTLKRKSNGIKPEDEVTAAKIKKIKRIAQYFALKNQDLINEKRGWQIDLIAIIDNNNQHQIRHYENI